MENLLQSPTIPNFCQDRALLCPTSADVDQINDYMLSLLPGAEKFCHSDDCIPANDDPDPKDFMLLSPVFFGTCIIPGVPKQILRLKVGAPVVLLMDVDPSRGLCRGTRLQITLLGETMIEARFATCSSNDVDKVLIPKMHMSPTKESFEIRMRRTQFPLKLAFAMTIDESQGQKLFKVGLYLPRRVLSHGQRYVAISKVKTKTGFQILITNEGVNGKPEEDTKNLVVKKLFQDI